MSQINPMEENAVELAFADNFSQEHYLLEGKEIFLGHPQNKAIHLRAQILQVIDGQSLLIKPLAKSEQLDVRILLTGTPIIKVRMAVPNGVLCFESKQIPHPQRPNWTIGLQWPEQTRIEQTRNFPRVALHQALLVEKTGEVRRRAIMLNLSEQGLQVEYHAPLGMIGETLRILLVLPFEEGALIVEATAVIRSKFSEISEDHVLHGLEFDNLTTSMSNTIRRYMQQRLCAKNDSATTI